MRRTYTPPPGYRGTSFSSEKETVGGRSKEGAFSEGGIPTERGRTLETQGQHSDQTRKHTSHEASHTLRGKTSPREHRQYRDDKKENAECDDHRPHDTRPIHDDGICDGGICDGDRFARSGGRFSPIHEDLTCREAKLDTGSHRSRDGREHNRSTDKHDTCRTPCNALFGILSDNSDLLLILLLVLIAGEEGTESLVLTLALLFCVR